MIGKIVARGIFRAARGVSGKAPRKTKEGARKAQRRARECPRKAQGRCKEAPRE